MQTQPYLTLGAALGFQKFVLGSAPQILNQKIIKPVSGFEGIFRGNFSFIENSLFYLGLKIWSDKISDDPRMNFKNTELLLTLVFNCKA